MSRKKNKKIDKKFLIIVLILIFIGLIAFVSTSLGVYVGNKKLLMSVVLKHVGLGVFGGLFVMYITSHIHFNFWRKYSFFIYILSLVITLLVFVPGLGFSHGGAYRWISLGFISFQPAELLKFGVILFISAWFASSHKEIFSVKKGILPFFIILAPAVLVLAKQPDSGSFVLIGLVSFIIYYLQRPPLKHIILIILIGLSFLTFYIAMKPYAFRRIETFLDNNKDPYGSSYQVRQSKIAIGSGGLWGRGPGQSVQKFGSFLPESNSDSIFAIFSEEFGFIGNSILIFFYILLTFLGLRIAKRAPNLFAQNLVIGIILLIIIQVFLNIAAISGVFPLSGMPLIFMSKGGTALLVTLAEIGIILNISRYQKKNKKF